MMTPDIVKSAMAAGIACSLCLTACARPIPKPAAGAAGVPRVGWVIMTGDRDNPDREFVCYSESPGACVIPASRPNEPVFADVHLYYHPAATDTKYGGTVRIDFFNSPLDLRPNLTVKPGAQPGNQSVAGIVSAKPGTHALSLRVDATAMPGGTQQMREDVKVVVR